jgi:hypothetical protein
MAPTTGVQLYANAAPLGEKHHLARRLIINVSTLSEMFYAAAVFSPLSRIDG